MEIFAAILVLTLLTLLSFWQGKGVKSVVLWLATGATSIITGFFFFDTYPDYLGLTFGIALLVFCFYCVGHAFEVVAKNREEDN